MTHRSKSVRTVLMLSLGLAMYACGGDDDDNGTPGATGGVAGSVPTAGAKTGGVAAKSGGTSPGGTGATAGVKSGGTSSGGKATAGGGAESGGAETAGTGGAESGGAETAGTGGAESGGAETAGGGAESGGAQSGGAATAGTGGAESGGAATAGGGAESGGAATAGGGAESGGAETAGVGGEATGGAPTAGAGGEATGGAETAGAGGETTGGAANAGAGGESTGGAAAGGEAGAGGAGGAAAFCSTGTFAFCDDFEDGNSNGWTQFDQSSTLGNWTVATDPTGTDGNSTLDFQETDTTAVSTNYHYQVASGAAGGPWTDQTVTAWIKPVTAFENDFTKGGVCARMSSTDTAVNNLTGYCLLLRRDGNTANGTGRVQISRKATGTGSMSSVVSTTNGPIPLFAVGTWYKATLKVANAVGADGGIVVNVTGYINDVQLISGTDTTPVLTPGFAGVVTRAATPGAETGVSPLPAAANFDNVTLTSP